VLDGEDEEVRRMVSHLASCGIVQRADRKSARGCVADLRKDSHSHVKKSKIIPCDAHSNFSRVDTTPVIAGPFNTL